MLAITADVMVSWSVCLSVTLVHSPKPLDRVRCHLTRTVVPMIRGSLVKSGNIKVPWCKS